MKKSLILTWSGFQDQEVVYPYYRLLGAGFSCEIIGDQRDSAGRIYGILGSHVPCHVLFRNFEESLSKFLDAYDLLVLPGGVKALEKLRIEPSAVEFVRRWHDLGKPIASTCHGAQLLISAGAVGGRKVGGYYSIEDDIRNAGGEYSKDAVSIDGNLITSPHYDFMGEWMERAIEAVQ